MFPLCIVLKWCLFVLTCLPIINAITMEQFDQSLDMMRNGCAPKFKISMDKLDSLRAGQFDEGLPELRCYTKCIAQLAGTLTKKGEFSVQKAIAQIPIILPKELQERAKDALSTCKDIQKDYKDSCDKVFYLTKCIRDFDPAAFKFP